MCHDSNFITHVWAIFLTFSFLNINEKRLLLSYFPRDNAKPWMLRARTGPDLDFEPYNNIQYLNWPFKFIFWEAQFWDCKKLNNTSLILEYEIKSEQDLNSL
jgi:hypothetical protein